MSDWQKNKEARRMAYGEKLKDPRWQKLRLQVFERDGWACQRCTDTENTLNVHHLYYEDKREPWDYSLEAFRTLCQECHEAETSARPIEEQRLLQTLRKMGLVADGIGEIADGFENLSRQNLNSQEIALIPGLLWSLFTEDDHLKTLGQKFFGSLNFIKRDEAE